MANFFHDMMAGNLQPQTDLQQSGLGGFGNMMYGQGQGIQQPFSQMPVGFHQALMNSIGNMPVSGQDMFGQGRF